MLTEPIPFQELSTISHFKLNWLYIAAFVTNRNNPTEPEPEIDGELIVTNEAHSEHDARREQSFIEISKKRTSKREYLHMLNQDVFNGRKLCLILYKAWVLI